MKPNRDENAIFRSSRSERSISGGTRGQSHRTIRASLRAPREHRNVLRLSPRERRLYELAAGPVRPRASGRLRLASASGGVKRTAAQLAALGPDGLLLTPTAACADEPGMTGCAG